MVSSRKSTGEWLRALSEKKTFGRIFGVGVVATVYFAAAKLGLSLAFVAEQVSPVWPPTGIALATVLLFGYQFWPGITLGAFLANMTANEPVPTACGIAIGNTLEAVIGAWLLRRVFAFDTALQRVKDAIALILIAAILSTMISATIGVISLSLGRVYLPELQRTIAWSDFWTLWWEWWLGDAMGALLVAPPLLTWATGQSQRSLRRPVEALALIAGLIATSWVVFLGGLTTGLGGSSLAYIVFPFVIWAALRFGQRATTAVTLVASSMTIWATLQGLGPFGAGPVHDRLLLLQVFMGVVASTALLLGAALAERQRAEQTLHEADRRKDEFLATLAHELRNPLAPIRTGVDLIRMMDLDNLELREVLEMLDRQVQQITRLVDDLLDVSRVTRGKIHLQLQSIDLATVAIRAVETSQPILDGRGHELTVTLPHEPLYVHADSIRLIQVLANLLNNAAKYTEQGGRITLTVAREGHEATVRVCDTGQGIDRELLPRVFDLFAQGDRSRLPSHGGLGIGLTLVRSLVEMHGGSVEAFSQGLGAGSEFVVRLPLDPDAQMSPTNPVLQENGHPNVTGAARRILVVDDNLDAARSLAILLKTAGHQVHTAHTGPTALEMAATHRPAVVLLDIGLPEMTGYEVARRIREQPWGRDIVLIAVTGWGQPEDRRQAIESGFNHHLTKPVELATLTDLLGRLTVNVPPIEGGC
jgi:signal transduction histidine kinase/ActR/RegA family two-component response regulator